MKFLTVLIISFVTVSVVNGGTLGVPAKVGESVVLEFGSAVKNITISLDESEGGIDRRPIVENGKLTQLAVEKFGNRASFENGNLTIRDLKVEDSRSYFYKDNGQPHVIDIILTQ